jgi:septal ring factor EnvC (AmiA/AmiB activator)
VYSETGDVIEAGEPLGLMGDAEGKSGEVLSTDGDETGAARTETLYIEIREQNRPVDPNAWFRTEKDR